MGNISELNPRTNPTFATFEPTTFPIAIVGDPIRTACILITSSGRDVPKAMTVNPMTKADT
jgi:hypothetical protein